MIVMRVGDVGEGDGDSVLLHGCDITERLSGGNSAEAGEAVVAMAIGDDVAIDIGQRATGADYGRDEGVSKQSHESLIATLFLGQDVGFTSVSGRADWIAGGAVN